MATRQSSATKDLCSGCWLCWKFFGVLKSTKAQGGWLIIGVLVVGVELGLE